MVKCQRGTPSQIKANLAYINKSSTVSDGNDLSQDQEEKESDLLLGEAEGSEFDSVRADKRCPPKARDELIYFFVNCFLDLLLESWEGKPCLKPKFFSQKESEEYGEDLGPCDPSVTSSMADYLSDLYRKRSSSILKEKGKKESETTESEYLNEEDYEPPPSPVKPLTDEDVHFVFLNGVWYKGRVSRRLMDGEGLYFWEDGTVFEGEFEGGFATGKGRLEFPDLSTYEGGVYKAFRHGEGMFCFSDSPVMYSGDWWLGKKHGEGLILYRDPAEGHDFYKGQWQDGVKEGFGFRQYPSGAMYIGFWSNGKRHGKGVMFWSNHDIYRGYWKEGLMHGFGEYTWNGFINKTLSYPATNTYRGYWENGMRNGRGLLELKNGALIETVWVNNCKEGPGVVVCTNGVLYSCEKVFEKDKPAGTPDEKIKFNKQAMEEQASLIIPNIKLPSIPIHAPIHKLYVHQHIQKLETQLRIKMCEELQWESNLESVTPNFSTPKSNPGDDASQSKTEMSCMLISKDFDEQNERKLQKEEKMLRNFILTKICFLKNCYEYYAKLSCQDPPTFDCVLLRLFLWQMLIDGDVPDSNLSLIEIDDILAKEDYILLQESHDPFERIQLWQFIQILIVLSWHIYGQYVFGVRPLVEDQRLQDFIQYYEDNKCRCVIKLSLEYFMNRHLLWQSSLYSQGVHKFEESDFAPMEAMYLIYCDVGEPHSARDFLNMICRKEKDVAGTSPTIVRYFEKLPFYKVEGKNVLTIAGELQHMTDNKPFNTPEIFQLEEMETKVEPKSELTCFNNLSAKTVVQCLMEICPGVMECNCIVNMDYKLTFLEFYKAIILCTKVQLKLKMLENVKESVIAEYKLQLEEYNRQMSEFEKQRESLVPSRKKSRQLEAPKKGKK